MISHANLYVNLATLPVIVQRVYLLGARILVLTSIDSSSDRRLTENKEILRESNIRKQSWFFKYKEYAKIEPQETTSLEGDVAISFYCECADENCMAEIQIMPTEYSKIHSQSDVFMIVSSHETPEIEEVISKKAQYCLVKKT